MKMIGADVERGTATFTGDVTHIDDEQAARMGVSRHVKGLWIGPRDIDEAQHATHERFLDIVECIATLGGQPSYVHMDSRHRWVARWTTRTGKALARRLWGAA